MWNRDKAVKRSSLFAFIEMIIRFLLLSWLTKVNYIDGFLTVPLTLHSWNKPQLVMMHYFLNKLLQSICYNLCRIFAHVLMWDNSVQSSFLMSLSNLNVRVMLASQIKLITIPTSIIFWKCFCRTGIIYSWNKFDFFNRYRAIQVLFLPEWSLVECIFWRICLFHLCCKIYRYKVAHNILLLSFYCL